MSRHAGRPRKGKRERTLNFWTYIVLIASILIVNLPFLQMLATAFKTRQEALSGGGFLPVQWSVESFDTVINQSSFLLNMRSSLLISLCVTCACVVFSIMAAYAISRFRGRVFRAYTLFMLVLQLFPAVLMLIPLFVIFRLLGLVDTHMSLILAYTSINLPFSIWLLKGFLDTIPRDIEQAGMIDGCSQFGAFRRLVVPLALPGVSTVAIFTFINAWGEYTIASILIRSEGLKTMTIGLSSFSQQWSTDWPATMAASALCTIPTLLFLVFAQKYLISGMSAGSVKG